MYDESIMAGIMALGALAIIVCIIFIPILVVYIIGIWKLFKKAGKNGWEAIIPFYNSWTLVEISGLNWWYFLIMISSYIVSLLDIDGLSGLCWLASLVASFFCYYNISKKLHKTTGFAVLMTIFPVIMIPVVGFSKDYQFDNSVSVSVNGPIGDNNNQSNTSTVVDEVKDNTDKKFCTNCGEEITTDTKYCPKCGNEIK